MSGIGQNRAIVLGDNLEGLAKLQDESVTLAYCDPPFNSGRSYEAVLGLRRETTRAFEDTWAWGEGTDQEQRHLRDLVPPAAAALVASLVDALGKNELSAYLVMMTARLGEMHRVLDHRGSLYVHCDPAASHYLKVILDHIFGAENFRNEIIWRRTHAHSSSRRFGPVHDVILFYSKSKEYVWNQVYAPYSDDYIQKYFTKQDAHGKYQLITCTAPGDRTGTRVHYRWRGQLPPSGRHWAWTKEKMEDLDAQGLLVHSSKGTPRLKRYVNDGAGVRVQDVWNDIGPLGAHSSERTGFETQKPLRLLTRIIEASTNEGDHVLDVFSGSGTTAVAAEEAGRTWTAMDSSLLACSLTLARVRQVAPAGPIELANFPSTPVAMRRLRDNHPVTFAAWGTGMLGTLLDKQLFSEAIAGGRGRMRSSSEVLNLRSLVPLRGRVALSEVPYGSDVDRVFILDTGRAISQLTVRLQEERGRDVVPVTLDECLSREATTNGIAPTVAAAGQA